MIKMNRKRRGATLAWSIVALFGLIAVAALGLDWARVTLVKTEMQQAADAIALAAASRLGEGTTKAKAIAEKTRQANYADDKSIHMSRLEFGGWDSTHSQYTQVTVELERSSQHGGSVPLTLGQVVGMQAKNVKVRAVARVIPEISVEQDVQGTANPFLAGMPEGTVASLYNPHNSPDYAGNVNSKKKKDWKQSPIAVKGLPLTPGQALTFDNIGGTTQHDPGLPFYEPDGQTGENGTKKDIGNNTRGSEHGIADIKCPINALVGVFLGPGRPDNTSAPASLDASTHASRNQLRYEPKLKQIFFIGDGLTWGTDANGKQVAIPQEFIVPEGATRLYLATWDFYEWNNNGGERTIEIKRPKKVMLME